MMVRMLVNHGRLKTNQWYEVKREGRDWYYINGLYVDKDWVTTERVKVRKRRRERSNDNLPSWE